MDHSNAILLCGGIGRRMSPISSCNKSLLKIRGEINLLRIIRLLYERGIREIVIATNPIFETPINGLIRDLGEELTGLSLLVSVAEDYVKGCNNILTLRSASRFLNSTYILETDQYYTHLNFVEDAPRRKSALFTQRRNEDDWGVISDEASVKAILRSNPNNLQYCLSGVSYFTPSLSKKLSYSLNDSVSNDLYWEEMITPDLFPYIEEVKQSEYSLEYDDISDLINKNLMTPDEIADLIDERGSAERLGSMTNTTYKVKVGGRYYALRIPGYGTDKFVNHHRERIMESSVSTSIRPESIYYSGDSVKLTEFLEGYETLCDIKDFPKVLKTLYKLHSNSELGYPDNRINLKKEIKSYESIYKIVLHDYEGYEEFKSDVFKFLDQWFKEHPYTKVHRDLVPQNIMIKGNDVKLIDWEYSGYLSYYWDLASLSCEFSDYYLYDLDSLVTLISEEYPMKIEESGLYKWIAVVDFVWAVWSLAKTALGDPWVEYGNRRYERAKSLFYKY